MSKRLEASSSSQKYFPTAPTPAKAMTCFPFCIFRWKSKIFLRELSAAALGGEDGLVSDQRELGCQNHTIVSRVLISHGEPWLCPGALVSSTNVDPGKCHGLGASRRARSFEIQHRQTRVRSSRCNMPAIQRIHMQAPSPLQLLRCYPTHPSGSLQDWLERAHAPRSCNFLSPAP